ncbi:WD40 repeat-like protein [Irpex rosettiformis]|uniref:WD40 repeat-like protein n=1 Tax=Irpex rosettiformis TaxID=378272 RepID=A0ACB8UDU2_9APHY|nr:WD40 repeat-like protein [Irpex rosettiformis]
MSLVESATFTSTSKAIRTVSLPSGAYVLSLASLPSLYAASSSAPTNGVHLFDKTNLRAVATLPGHDDTVTCMRVVSNIAGSSRETLITSGKDAFIKVWDERAGSPAFQMSALSSGSRRPLLSCDVSPDGLTVAAGTVLQGDDASLLYWDPRNPAAPLRTHTYTHSDDITAVHFLKSQNSSQNVLLSASTDGLVCTTNPDEDDEDEAALNVGNWGCSIAQAGWIHGRSGPPGVWTASDMETFGTWSGELDMVEDVDIRQPSIHRRDFTWVTDYLIACHNNTVIPSNRDNDLSLFLGSNEGDIALITRSTLCDLNVPWSMERLWKLGHVGVVRSALWDERNNILLTGGEDSKLNAWPCPSLSSESSDLGSDKRESDSTDMDVDEEDRSPDRKKRRP